MPGSGVGPPPLASQLPAAFPSIRSLLSRSFLLFHHVGWGQASAPATAATDWPATATQAQYKRGKFHSYFASTLRSRSGRPENGRRKKTIIFIAFSASAEKPTLRLSNVSLYSVIAFLLAIQANMHMRLYISLLCWNVTSRLIIPA